MENKEYRSIVGLTTQSKQKRIDSDYYVEGVATTFNDPYLMIEASDFKVYEEIDRNALAETDMADVKFQVNHAGTVYARMKQGTLGLEIDGNKIYAYADLSKTTRAREIYEEIDAGYIDKMSWAFIVAEDEYRWNKDLTVCTRTVNKVKKIYEVSGVSEPANPNTELEARGMTENKENSYGEILNISVRNLLDGAIESRKQELLEREKALKFIKAKYDHMEEQYGIR